MRITIDLDDGLLATAKRRAAQLDQTLDWVIEDALRRARLDGEYARPTPVLPDFAYEGGLRPGVDLFDRTAVGTLLGDDYR